MCPSEYKNNTRFLSKRIVASTTKYTTIYCNNCKKILGKYNAKFYNNEKINEMLKTVHIIHIKNGHTIQIKKNISI